MAAIGSFFSIYRTRSGPDSNQHGVPPGDFKFEVPSEHRVTLPDNFEKSNFYVHDLIVAYTLHVWEEISTNLLLRRSKRDRKTAIDRAQEGQNICILLRKQAFWLQKPMPNCSPYSSRMAQDCVGSSPLA